MPSQPAQYVMDPDGNCTCGRRHASGTKGARPCKRHRSKHHPTDPGGPCCGSAMRGQDLCPAHGGKAKQNMDAAERRMDAEKAQKLLAEALTDAYGDDVPDVPPADAMLRAVSWTYAEVTVLRRKVAELGDHERVWGVTREKTGGDDHGTTEEARPNIWWTMLREAMRDLVKFAAAARAAGCDEARVRIAEQQGMMLADVIRAILGDLDLTAQQQQLVSTVVPRHLRAIAG